MKYDEMQLIKDRWFTHALLREGYKTSVYKDSLGKLTVGIGHLVRPEDNLKLGDQITAGTAFRFFEEDTKGAIEAAIEQAREIGCMQVNFIVALISVNYQLGTKWHTQKFPNTYKALVDGDYDLAIQKLSRKNLLWRKQTPVRVDDFIDAIRKLKRRN